MRMTTVADYGGLALLKADGKQTKRFPLLQKRYLFGRADYCDIRVNLINVSREHAEIVVDEKNQVWVRSLSLTAVTTVDETMVRETILKDGNKIGIGGKIGIGERFFIYYSHCNAPGSANTVRAAALWVPLGQVWSRDAVSKGIKRDTDPIAASVLPRVGQLCNVSEWAWMELSRTIPERIYLKRSARS